MAARLEPGRLFFGKRPQRVLNIKIKNISENL